MRLADKITLLCEANVCLHVCLPLLLSCSSVCKRSIPPSCESCVRGRVAQTDEERQIGCLSCHRSSGSTRLAGRSSVQPYEHRKGHVSVWAASFVVRLLLLMVTPPEAAEWPPYQTFHGMITWFLNWVRPGFRTKGLAVHPWGWSLPHPWKNLETTTLWAYTEVSELVIKGAGEVIECCL